MPDRSDAASDPDVPGPTAAKRPDASVDENPATDTAAPTFTMIGADGAVCVDGVCAWPGAGDPADKGGRIAEAGASDAADHADRIAGAGPADGASATTGD